MSPYRVPFILWFASAAGLTVMLLGEGAYDVFGLLAAAAPAFAVARAGLQGKTR